MNTNFQEIQAHQSMQQRMVEVARRMMESKQQLQEEIKNDMQRPEIKAAVEELKRRHAARARQTL